STAFKTAVNHLLYSIFDHLIEAPTGLNHHPVSPAHSTRIRHPVNLFFRLTLCFSRSFSGGLRRKWCAL
ncbi:hypothetical protein, partial [Pseudomonas subflava]|uniref:hypothetical protein n=1 Tax=Pseudomonas subflava TaxID=2952933 RepID=UPI002079A842